MYNSSTVNYSTMPNDEEEFTCTGSPLSFPGVHHDGPGNSCATGGSANAASASAADQTTGVSGNNVSFPSSGLMDDQNDADRNTTEEGDKNPRYAPTTWFAVAAMCLMYVVQSGVENGYVPCTLTTLQGNFNASNATMAAVTSTVDGSKAVGSIVSGYLGSVRKTQVISLGGIIWVVGCVLYGIGAQLWMLFVGQFLMGIGAAPLSVLCPAVLEDLVYDKPAVPHFLGIVYVFSAVGVVAAFVLCALFGDYWRWNFMSFAALAVIPIVMLLRPSLSPPAANGATGFKALMSVVSDSTDRLPFWASMRSICTNGVIMLSIASQTIVALYIGAFINLTPKFIEQGLGKSKSSASFVMAGTVPVIAVSTFAGGFLSMKCRFFLKKKLLFIIFCNVIVIPTMFCWRADSIGVFAVGLMFGMTAVFLTSSPAVTLMGMSVEDLRLVAFANTVVNVSIRVFGSVPGPIILGGLLDSGTPMVDAYFGMGIVSTFVALVFSILALFAFYQGWYRSVPDDAEPQPDSQSPNGTTTSGGTGGSNNAAGLQRSSRGLARLDDDQRELMPATELGTLGQAGEREQGSSALQRRQMRGSVISEDCEMTEVTTSPRV